MGAERVRCVFDHYHIDSAQHIKTTDVGSDDLGHDLSNEWDISLRKRFGWSEMGGAVRAIFP